MGFVDSERLNKQLKPKMAEQLKAAQQRNPRFVVPPPDAPVVAQQKLNLQRGKAARRRNTGGM